MSPFAEKPQVSLTAAKPTVPKKQVRRYISIGNMEMTLRKGFHEAVKDVAGVTLSTVWKHPVRVSFTNRYFETDDPDVQIMLERDRLFGSEYYWHPQMKDHVEGFDDDIAEKFDKSFKEHRVSQRGRIRQVGRRIDRSEE